MRNILKENNQSKINLNLDFKSYRKFINSVEILGKDLESKSNVKKLSYSIVISGIKIPTMPCKGWTSRCEDMKHVLFCDFDNILWWILETQLGYLQDKYNLPPFYVFTTSEAKDCNNEIYGNYIVINLEKHKFMDIVKMQDEISCDESHKRLPLIYRFHSWVLRLSPKGDKARPKFRCIIGDISKEYNQSISEAHLNILKKLYPEIQDIKYTNKDGLNKLWGASYKTASV